MKLQKERIVFFSKDDGSAGHNLRKAENLMLDFDSGRNLEINDLLELYQVKLYFDNEVYLKSWLSETITKYKLIVAKFWDYIVQFWIGIENDNIEVLYNQVEHQFYGSFWELFNNLQTYKKINSNTIESILRNERIGLRYILRHEKVISYYSTEIRKLLLEKKGSAELLLSSYEEEHIFDQPKLYFPANLSLRDKELIFNEYIEAPDANINYVRLIVNSKNIKLSDKLKFKAKKLADKLNKEIFEKGSSWNKGVQVSISKDQVAPVIKSYSVEESTISFSYNESWLNHTLHPFEIFRNFRSLFAFLNGQGCINLVSKSCEVDPFERTFMHSKNEYFLYSKFIEKSILSQLQLNIYVHFLKANNIKIEDTLSFIVNEFINENFNIKGLKIRFPSESTTYLEKIRTLAPELDFLLKQYKCYVEDGFIDFELLQFSSSQLNFSELKSRTSRKYVYGIGDEFIRLKYYFFSSQSMLHYIEKYQNQYRNLYELLEKESITYDDFKDYQKLDLDYLISNQYLDTDAEGFIRIKNHVLITVILVLHYEDVLNFWCCPDIIRNEILEMQKQGLVVFDNLLFTTEERRYLNYFLNQKEFTNGLDLRNKYMHGTNSNSPEEQQNDYNALLKLVILVIWKLFDDLSFEKEEIKTGANNRFA